MITDVSLAVRFCSWNAVDLPGFRAILFERAKVYHAAGAAHFQPIMK